jgi:putative GTP pyrophosphokinase
MSVCNSKTAYIFDGATEKNISDETVETIRSFLAVENIYMSAIREISTKLENLNGEFKYSSDRNPIHQIKSRVKTPMSIIDKLEKKGFDISIESARENLDDIAGIRVICSYIDDIYLIADMLLSQDDIELVRIADYIASPKPNGYRSLHLIIRVPVFLSRHTENVKVEIQIRTIAMDFWASLEHELAYKMTEGKTDDVIRELKDCADVIASTDIRMQNLHNMVRDKKAKSPSDTYK